MSDLVFYSQHHELVSGQVEKLFQEQAGADDTKNEMTAVKAEQ